MYDVNIELYIEAYISNKKWHKNELIQKNLFNHLIVFLNILQLFIIMLRFALIV